MGVFHVFKILQMVPIRAKHHISYESFLETIFLKYGQILG